ncbi:MAG: hypothetical protein AAF235_06930 [Planctomycetota bacterium]
MQGPVAIASFSVLQAVVAAPVTLPAGGNPAFAQAAVVCIADAYLDSRIGLPPLWEVAGADLAKNRAMLDVTPEAHGTLTLVTSATLVAPGGQIVSVAALETDPFAPVSQEGSAAGVSFDAGALTTLSDGGLRLGAARPDGVSPVTKTDKFHPGFVETGEAEFQLYAIDMRLAPLQEGPLSLGLKTGVRAIRADLSRELGGTGTAGFTPVPVIGTDVRWKVSPSAYFAGTAMTEMVGATGDVLDLKAEAGMSFSRKIDFAVGYQYLRSTIDAGPRDATLEQEGPFARLRISF